MDRDFSIDEGPCHGFSITFGRVKDKELTNAMFLGVRRSSSDDQFRNYLDRDFFFDRFRKGQR